MTYILYKETETTGCVYEDGADTRFDKVKFRLVENTPEEREEYGEWCASKYGDQDYSYQFSSKKIAEFDGEEMLALRDTIEELFKKASHSEEPIGVDEDLNAEMNDPEYYGGN